MQKDTTELNQFITLSSALTDFNAFSLNGTGQVEAYYQTLLNIVGPQLTKDLLDKFESIHNSASSKAFLIEAIRQQILGDLTLGPIARNLMKLWYTGTWYQLPNQWREANGQSDNDITFFVNYASYMEGLLWQAIDANPSGAKAPGYGSWANPPKINFDNAWEFTPNC